MTVCPLGVTVGGVVVDQQHDLASPRAVAKAAPLHRRIAALVVDLGIDSSPILLLTAIGWFADGALFGACVALFGIGAIAVVMINEYALVVSRGQSVGKRLLGIQVVDSHTMLPPHGWEVVWRNAAKSLFGGGFAWTPLAAASGFTIIVGAWPLICFAPAIADRWHRGLHDRWAHTVVIDVRVAPD